MSSLDGTICSISNGRVCIKSDLVIIDEKGLATFADHLEIESDKEIVDPIYSDNNAIVTLEDGTVLKDCKILSIDGKRVSVSQNRVIIDANAVTIKRSVARRFMFNPTNGKHIANILYYFDNGMTSKIMSDIFICDNIESRRLSLYSWKYTPKSDTQLFAVEQRFSITNNTCMDLENIKEFHLNFQNNYEVNRGRSGYERVTAIPNLMAKASSIREDRSDISDVSAPINIGHIRSLPSYSTVHLPSSNAVLLSVLERYVDISIGSKSCTVSYKMRVEEVYNKNDDREGYLYPSTGRIKSDIGVEQGAVNLPLKKIGDDFELYLGENISISVIETASDNDKYHMKIKSTSAYRYKIRINGYRVKDDTIFDLPAGGVITCDGNFEII